MIDIHPPQHGSMTRRDFFVHLGIVVLGILIAIGLEQTIEYFHHLRQVAETREALRAEREQNRHALANGMAEFHRQTAALENNLIILNYLQQHPGTPEEKLPGILLWHATRTQLSDSAWKTAQQSNVTTLMPQDEVRRDALLYERIEAVDKTFDEIWPVIIQARLYALGNPDPSRLTPAQVADEIQLTKTALARNFTSGGALVQLGRADPGFTPALTPEELNRMMRVTKSETDPALARAIAQTNARLPSASRLPIPHPAIISPQKVSP